MKTFREQLLEIGRSGITNWYKNDVEEVIHELSHVVTLRIQAKVSKFFVSERVVDAIFRKSEREADMDEVKALACEYHVLKRSGLHKYKPLTVDKFLMSGLIDHSNWVCLSEDSATELIRQNIKTKAAKSRATEVRKLAQSLTCD